MQTSLMQQQDVDRSGRETGPQNWPAAGPQKRRRTPSHRGVQLKKPDGPKNPHWRARYVDPDSRKALTETLSPADGRTAETRAAFAMRIWRRLQKRRQEIKDGAQPFRMADHPLAKLIHEYYSAHTNLRERTAEGYKEATDIFLTWCDEQGVTTPRALSRGKLVEFRTSRINAPNKVREGTTRSEYTVNKELTRVGIVLGWLVDSEKLRLTRDDVRIGLKKIDTETSTLREFLRSEQISALLEAARRHDAICYRSTRAEHKKGTGNTTPRYAQIEGWIRFLLLSGCRRSEALAITWANVDLASRRIMVYAAQTKTKFDRVIELEVCPTLVEMLANMSKGKKPFERVWEFHTKGSVDAALDRLRADSLCPPFNFQVCRVTCATFLANMPSFGPVNESRQLGHALSVADKFYLGRVRIDPAVTTLEEAYGLTPPADRSSPSA